MIWHSNPLKVKLIKKIKSFAAKGFLPGKDGFIPKLFSQGEWLKEKPSHLKKTIYDYSIILIKKIHSFCWKTFKKYCKIQHPY